MGNIGYDGRLDEALPSWWTRYSVGLGRVGTRPGSVRLVIEDAVGGVLADAQIDDYHGYPRGHLPWRPPLRLEVRARWSHPSQALRGTTGFGFWNDPLDATGKFVATPSCLWFFHASPPSRLRLRNKPAGDGFVSGSMRGGEIGRPLLFAGNLALRLPGVNRLATRLGERRVGGGNVLLPAFDLTDWHDFCLDWNGSGAHFAIDGIMVATFEPTEIPSGPLGFVAWIDTNWTRLDADGRYQGGRLAAPGQQWLDLARVAITHGIVGPHRLSVAHR